VISLKWLCALCGNEVDFANLFPQNNINFFSYSFIIVNLVDMLYLIQIGNVYFMIYYRSMQL